VGTMLRIFKRLRQTLRRSELFAIVTINLPEPVWCGAQRLASTGSGR
jgi:hypothetical protein